MVPTAMFTVSQCLAKAVELEARADEPHAADIRAEFRDMAADWRHLACSALTQDQRAADRPRVASTILTSGRIDLKPKKCPASTWSEI